MTWTAGAVVDDFASAYSIEDIAAISQAVGFNNQPRQRLLSK
jgi:hypothetical protein